MQGVFFCVFKIIKLLFKSQAFQKMIEICSSLAIKIVRIGLSARSLFNKSCDSFLRCYWHDLDIRIEIVRVIDKDNRLFTESSSVSFRYSLASESFHNIW